MEPTTNRSQGTGFYSQDQAPRALSPHLHYAVLLIIIVFFASVRFRLRNLPLERDEGEYAYVGQLMLQGVPPYKLAANMKLPGTYAAYALIMAAFGQTATGIHLGLLFTNAATTVLIFLLGKRVHGPLCGTVAGLTYALLSARLSVLGLSAHATHFVAFFAVAGLVCHLRAIASGEKRWFLVSGLLLGTAFVMKQPGIFFPIFALLDLIRRDWKQCGERCLGRKAAVYALGAVLPFAVICLALLAAGVFKNFWFWTFSYAAAHTSLTNFSAGLEAFRSIFFPWITRPRAVWAIAALGLPALIWGRQAHAHAKFVAGFVFFSFLAVCPGLYFRPHYFILLLPAVSLLAGICVSSATGLLQQCWIRFLPASIPVVLCFLFLASYIFGQRKLFWKLSPLEVCRNEYPGEPYPEAIAVADYLRAHVPERDQIAILGSEAEIYFYSRRRSATSYIYMHPFSEKQPFASRMQQEMINQLEAARPTALVYVDDQLSWGWTPDSKPRLVLSWMQDYVSKNYELAERITFNGNVQHLAGESPSLSVYLRRKR